LNVHLAGDDIFLTGRRRRNRHAGGGRKFFKVGRHTPIANNPTNQRSLKRRQIRLPIRHRPVLLRRSGRLSGRRLGLAATGDSQGTHEYYKTAKYKWLIQWQYMAKLSHFGVVEQ